MESNRKPETKSLPQPIYRAVRWVAGTYQPGEENVHRGIFLTADGWSVPAQLTWQLRGSLKQRHPDYAKRPDLFEQSYRWTIYPKTDPLQFHLVGMKLLTPERVDAP
jgi:hypothetical protein